MNLQSEIQYFTELAYIDKARLLNSFLHELAEEARTACGPGTEAVHDTLHLRFVNEIVFRLTRLIEQLLAEMPPVRPTTSCCACCSPRADKVAERLMFNARPRGARASRATTRPC